MGTSDRAVQAAAEALSNADGPAFVGSANRRFVAEAAVAAAREVIASDIEFLSLGCRNDETQRLDALEAAARIARGGTP